MDTAQILAIALTLILAALSFRVITGHWQFLSITSSTASTAKSTRRHILMLGESNSGKTQFIHALIQNSTVAAKTETVPSMVSNSLPIPDYVRSSVTIPSTATIIDTPGHARLKRHSMQTHLPNARLLLFFVDSTSSQFSTQLPVIADYLYRVLCQSVALGIGALLVVCNKQDSLLALRPEVIRERLEAELDVLRSTTSSLGTTAAASSGDASDMGGDIHGDGEGMRYLGYEDKPFAFGDVEVEVDVVGASVKQRDAVVEWIQSKW